MAQHVHILMMMMMVDGTKMRFYKQEGVGIDWITFSCTFLSYICNDSGCDGAHDDLVDIGHGGSVDNHDTPGS